MTPVVLVPPPLLSFQSPQFSDHADNALVLAWLRGGLQVMLIMGGKEWGAAWHFPFCVGKQYPDTAVCV